MARRSVVLSAASVRVLRMLKPYPWEAGAADITIDGRRVSWGPQYDSRILAQSSPSIGFSRTDAAKIRAAIPGGRRREKLVGGLGWAGQHTDRAVIVKRTGEFGIVSGTSGEHEAIVHVRNPPGAHYRNRIERFLPSELRLLPRKR